MFPISRSSYKCIQIRVPVTNVSYYLYQPPVFAVSFSSPMFPVSSSSHQWLFTCSSQLPVPPITTCSSYQCLQLHAQFFNVSTYLFQSPLVPVTSVSNYLFQLPVYPDMFSSYQCFQLSVPVTNQCIQIRFQSSVLPAISSHQCFQLSITATYVSSYLFQPPVFPVICSSHQAS